MNASKHIAPHRVCSSGSHLSRVLDNRMAAAVFYAQGLLCRAMTCAVRLLASLDASRKISVPSVRSEPLHGSTLTLRLVDEMTERSMEVLRNTCASRSPHGQAQKVMSCGVWAGNVSASCRCTYAERMLHVNLFGHVKHTNNLLVDKNDNED